MGGWVRDAEKMQISASILPAGYNVSQVRLLDSQAVCPCSNIPEMSQSLPGWQTLVNAPSAPSAQYKWSRKLPCTWYPGLMAGQTAI